MELDSLLVWFEYNQRSLPWRENRTPYRVWVSETMLQQTRAVVVVDYFERWMEALPTLEDLAQADLKTVLKLWEGLGYYSRARNLHFGAQQIVKDYNGEFPNTLEQLLSIKGIGPYTASAILAFAFSKNVVALDGNVKRVLSRYFGIKSDITKAEGASAINAAAKVVAEKGASWKLAEALIELGALVCLPSPNCAACPLSESCSAKIANKQNMLPIKKKRAKTERLKRLAFIFEHKGYLLVKKNAQGKVMADLYEFPYIEVEKEPTNDKVLDLCRHRFRASVIGYNRLDNCKHTFTRFHVELFPYFLACDRFFHPDGYCWHSLEEIKELTFSSGHRRILEDLLKGILCESCI